MSEKKVAIEWENIFLCRFFFFCSVFSHLTRRGSCAGLKCQCYAKQFWLQFILLNEVIQIVKTEEKQRVDTADGFIKWNTISSVNTIEYGIEYVDIRPC